MFICQMAPGWKHFMVVFPIRRFLHPFVSLLAGVAALGWSVSAHAAAKEKPVASVPPAKEPVEAGHPGPWGKLEISTIYIEAPDDLLEAVQRPNSIPIWNFPDGTEKELRELFTKAGLASAVQERILDPKRMLKQGSLLAVFPPIEDLKAMTQDARSIIYPELAKSELNEFHANPIYIVGGNVDEWLRETKLRPALQNLIRTMTWRSGSALVFSDLRTLLSQAESDAEVRHIFKTTTRRRTLLVRLKIDPTSDMKSLTAYWTAGGRSLDVVPMLEAAAERGCETEIDITHLLPPIPRRRLYTYPTMDLAVRGRMPDCHWTSLNFFELSVKDYFLDLRLAANRVMQGYEKINPPYGLGDILLFLNDKGNAVHSCVYIADNIVFTKNGENTLSPWLLKRLSDVEEIYKRQPDWPVQGYRKL